MLFRKDATPDATAEVERLRAENEQLRRAVAELSLLNELAADIGASSDLDTITRQIVRRALQSVGAGQGVITLVDGDDAEAPLRTLIRTVVGADGTALRPDEHLLGWMRERRTPLRLNRPQQSEAFAFVPWPAAITSMLCVPLTVRSRLIATLTLYNKSGGFTGADERLVSIIAAQTAQIIENARLVEEEKALVRVREELRLAHQIQVGLLPHAPPRVPGYDLAGRSVPAQTVGGDYYDFIAVADGQWALCVGDAVGKGLPAALLTASVQATLRGQSRPDLSAQEGLTRANDLLCSSVRDGEFVTLFYGCLDAFAHRFTFANAGHNPPFWLRAEAAAEPLSGGGLVLGAMAGMPYAQQTIGLERGDWVVLYSDGLTEATDRRGEPFGEARVAEAITAGREASAAEMIDCLLAAMERHTQGHPQRDDVTVVALKRC